MVKAVVGANWGDEGKGKITDMLAQEADIVIRFQGGANAGHTIVNNYGKFALHTLPSGVFYEHVTNIIGNGVALNVPRLFQEIKELTAFGYGALFPLSPLHYLYVQPGCGGDRDQDQRSESGSEQSRAVASSGRVQNGVFRGFQNRPGGFGYPGISPGRGRCDALGKTT